MADKLLMGHGNVEQPFQPKAKLTKKQQKEEKKLKKDLQSKQLAKERAEKLRLDQEAKEKVKKDAIQKKRAEADRLEHLEAERRRLAAKARQERETQEVKRRLEEIAIGEPRQLIKSAKKSVLVQLRDSMLKALEQEVVVVAIGTGSLSTLRKIISQSSEFDFKRTLLQEGYSVATQASPARILFDLKNSAGLMCLSLLNGEHKFLGALARFLFGINIEQDARFRIQFEATGYALARCLHCSQCAQMVDGPPQTLNELSLCLKAFFVANRIAWRDLDFDGVIKEIEKEPGRSERAKDALRRVRQRANTQARATHPCFDRRLSQMINDTSKQPWFPVIRDSTQSIVDHLSARKKVLSEFPPSFDDCMCKTCGEVGFKKQLVSEFDESRRNTFVTEHRIAKSD